jgi:hypothetical protein
VSVADSPAINASHRCGYDDCRYVRDSQRCERPDRRHAERARLPSSFVSPKPCRAGTHDATVNGVMATTLQVLGVVAATVAFYGVIFVLVPRAVLAAIRKPLVARVKARYPNGTDVVASDYTANSFGLESLGRTQLRGNGAFVITGKELVFFQYMPERDFVIPLAQVAKVSFCRSHLGKATLFRLVKICFQGEAGSDSIAVLVKHPDALRNQIEQARSAAD